MKPTKVNIRKFTRGARTVDQTQDEETQTLDVLTVEGETQTLATQEGGTQEGVNEITVRLCVWPCICSATAQHGSCYTVQYATEM